MSNLYIVATPIGNLKDITLRALETLFSVDYIACEDTRHTGQLLNVLRSNLFRHSGEERNDDSRIKFGFWTSQNDELIKSPKLISYYDEIEYKRMPEIIALLEDGKEVALVSDGGTPLVSDPGFKLVNECLKRGIKVISIPGPTAVISALVSSGLPTNNFWFLGYLPTKSTQRIKLLSSLNDSLKLIKNSPTLIFFEAPHRMTESLTDIKEVFGDREICIAKELTKIHEEVWRGKISDAQLKFNNTKGEIVILLSTPSL